MLSSKPWKQLAGCFIGLSAALALLVTTAVACDTPVYRYAMYRWEPAPYEIYYFHEEPISDEAAKLHEQIQATSRSEENPANVMFVPVPLKEDTELKRIPPDVKAAWTKQENPVIPSYMVVSPHGGQLHSGDLDQATFKALLDSPARSDIAKQLEEGKACVMVLLTGSDEAANTEAEKAVKTLFKDIAEGKVELYTMPPAYGFAGDEQPEPPKIEFGYVKVKRDDPQEKWLVDFLLSLEPDLKDEQFANQAMVFGVFGRGRALPPFVGKGINPDNLLDCIDFVTGACSCTVKDQNPGMDLLFTKDWWSAAEKLANAFGAEEGNEPQYGAADFFPQLMIPAGEEDGAAEAQAAPDDATMQVAAAQDQPPSEPADSPQTPAADSTAGDSTAEDGGEQPADKKPADAPAEQAPAGDDQQDPAQQKTAAKDGVDQETATTEKDEQDGAQPEPATAGQQAEDAGDEAAEMDAVGTETIIGIDERDTGEAEEPAAESHAAPTDSNTTSPESAHGAVQHDLEPTGTVGILAVGAGIAISLVLLFALTFVVLRPK
jgi:hypothetical protein